ncbi:restriction endonuclease subunit S [Shouchella lonarensis]|uniref:Type I restriction modification DNA specificity domain-containing protein n=1 Tax=Shouchella lonarensis TaxID=1464122 RepID=A0A1G6GIT3_9BACI|nr:restriction endonuclease subunit S [Shouchella lonarensis]SDB81844.1 Type I restriction modification DNA specificity domain-containing protein [Shouchella lonarensis]
MKILSELFEITYGNQFDFNKMKVLENEKEGVNFVGRSSQNHGVTANVKRLEEIEPFEAGLITVALGGTLSSFVQEKPFYTAQNVAVLKPLQDMIFEEKVFYCICIRHNRFRYSAFGREANRTLKDLVVPSMNEIPEWVTITPHRDLFELRKPMISKRPRLDTSEWSWFELSELFDVKKGKRLTKANMTEGDTLFIGAVDKNNGVTAKVGQEPIHKANTITVNYNGSVGEAFYQPEPYWCSDDVNALYPKFELNPYIALFLNTVIRQEKYRYNYGRKWHLQRMKPTKIKLPVDGKGIPDWDYMERFIKSLDLSGNIL